MNYDIVPYVTFRRYKNTSLQGPDYLNLKYGTQVIGTCELIITLEAQPVCYIESQDGYEHFASDHDGNGLERGALTYAIAYAQRENGTGYRFTEAEQQLLRDKWGHYLEKLQDAIIFNADFYKASIEDLKAIAADLSIRLRKGKYTYVRDTQSR